MLTYTITVWNSALRTDDPPFPWLIETLPASVTIVSISDGGVTGTITQSGSLRISPTTFISWTLPAMGPGETVTRTFTVLVPNDMISGTQIINNHYEAFWYEAELDEVRSNVGLPITTTVREIGLIDSYKEVDPLALLPGVGNVVTYTVHVVNSSPNDLSGVSLYDLFPWEGSTYQRDAIATSGSIISDIVSLSWTGNVAAFSEELITVTVVVDPNYEGPLTNTVTITHDSLLSPVEFNSTAYATSEPVLKIGKSAWPNPVKIGSELRYTIRVVNLGQQATNLVVTDTIPADTTYVPDSATAGGVLAGGGSMVKWTIPVLESGQAKELSFRVVVDGGTSIINDSYAVDSAEGVSAVGLPVVTQISKDGGSGGLYMPIIFK